MSSRASPAALGAIVLAAGLALVGLGTASAALAGTATVGPVGAAPVARGSMTGRIEEHAFYSRALGRTMPYAVYLPPGYATAAPNDRYPVLYLLHGRGDSHRSWIEYGLPAEADRLIAAGIIAPLLIVMPEGEAAFWVDHAGDGPRWGMYVSSDLVTEIDASLRTVPTRGARAIGGISMGGHGALQLAVRHPATFGIVGAHSVALRTRETAPAFLGVGPDFEARDPVSLFARHGGAARSLEVWIDIGTDDPWLPAAARFHGQLTGNTIPHRWTVWSGGHDAAYWRAHMADYLTYYGRALRDPAATASEALPASPPA